MSRKISISLRDRHAARNPRWKGARRTVHRVADSAPSLDRRLNGCEERHMITRCSMVLKNGPSHE